MDPICCPWCTFRVQNDRSDHASASYVLEAQQLHGEQRIRRVDAPHQALTRLFSGSYSGVDPTTATVTG